MIYITDSQFIDYTKTPYDVLDKLHEIYNAKIFTVQDSSATYRQVNSLDSSQMLPNDREGDGRWRRLCFIDVAYLKVIALCRSYGLVNTQLIELRDDFYKKEEKGNRLRIELVLDLILGSVKMAILVDKEGHSYVVDMPYHAIFGRQLDSYIYIDFNVIVNELKDLVFKKKTATRDYKDWLNLLVEYQKSDKLSAKEKQILEIIRAKDYKTITLRKKDDDSVTIYAEKEFKDTKDKEVEILRSLKDKDFTDVKITKRDGKIVHYTVEDIYKV